MQCTNCGNVVPEGFLFCVKCGTPVSAPEQDTPPKNAETIQVEEATEEVAEETEPETAVVAGTAEDDECAEEAADDANPEAEEAAGEASETDEAVDAAPASLDEAPEAEPAKKKRPKTSVIVAIVAAVVVIAIGVGIGVYFSSTSPYALDESTFPDATLRAKVAELADEDGDGSISRDEAKALTKLDLSKSEVSSLKGVEAFENLTTLNVSKAEGLTEADFSGLKNLESLNVSGTGLTSIDVSALSNLKSLNITSTEIAELDVSKNANLQRVYLPGAVTVTGSEAAGLHERYTMSKAVDSGNFGATDLNGVGGAVEKMEYTFSFTNAIALKSYTVKSTYQGGTTENGRKYDVKKNLIVAATGTGAEEGLEGSVEYDDAGRPVLVKSTDASGSKKATTTTRMKYADAGHLVEKAVEYSSGKSTTTYAYDKSGHITRIEYASGSTKTVSEFAYDDKGRLTSAKSGTQEFAFEYNDAGQLAKKSLWWYANGKRNGDPIVTTFEYDESGRIAKGVRTSTYSSGKTVWTSTVKYGNNGQVTSIERSIVNDSNGKKTTSEGKTEFKYSRVFVNEGTPEAMSPIEIGDPTVMINVTYPVYARVFDDGTQSPIAALTCEQVFNGSGFARL